MSKRQKISSSRLESFLKSQCDRLRTSMDAAEYKNYIIALLFLKRINDQFEVDRETLKRDLKKQFPNVADSDIEEELNRPEKYSCYVPEKARWDFLRHPMISAMDLAKELQLSGNDRLRSYIFTLLDNKIIIPSGSGKGTKYKVNPQFISNSKIQVKTSLKTLEPHTLKALVKEDLRLHPESCIADISSRIPDVEFHDIEALVRKMATNKEITPVGGRRYRKYSLLD